MGDHANGHEQRWEAELSCGCTAEALALDGQPFGRPMPGTYLTCLEHRRLSRVEGVQAAGAHLRSVPEPGRVWNAAEAPGQGPGASHC